MRKTLYTFISPVTFLSLLLLCTSVMAQRGRVYEFVNLPATARITALGGYAVPFTDNDLGMALYYPSLINPDLKNQLSLNFVDYFGDISYGTAAFSSHFNRLGSMTLAIQYVNYGVFTHTDEFGNVYNDFNAAEYAFNIGWGRQLTEKLSIGANLKAISSGFEEYASFGLAADIAVSYIDSERLLASSLVFRNMGRQITTYYNQREPLPFEVVLGVSKKLANAPLRFSLVAHNLQTFDLTYEDPIASGRFFTDFEPTQSSQDRMSEIGDKLMRHAVFGFEFVPSQNFVAGIGYNFRRRKEMGVDTRMSTVGLSWGIGVKVSNFMFHYGRSNYHLAGAPNHFSISTHLDRLLFRPAEQPSIR